jgi:hypothetical protein
MDAWDASRVTVIAWQRNGVCGRAPVPGRPGDRRRGAPLRRRERRRARLARRPGRSDLRDRARPRLSERGRRRTRRQPLPRRGAHRVRGSSRMGSFRRSSSASAIVSQRNRLRDPSSSSCVRCCSPQPSEQAPTSGRWQCRGSQDAISGCVSTAALAALTRRQGLDGKGEWDGRERA